MTDPEQTQPLPIWKDPRRYGWRPVYLLVSLVVLVLILEGCASLPPCPRFDARVFETPQGIFAVLDEKAIEQLAGRMKQLHERTCNPELTPAPRPRPAAIPAPSREPLRHELRPA